ncbi:4-coumarate--CoA ligase [Halovibrio salipaludis]|uniref:4-coumarate--CoA ligase n=1 Tax=Halovibrio salipaludis TaxID=2032626 RepID=A0A2A2F877_9GAMM|nr:AMP-binding protein [Halovibrio salipaludis]PAU81118.1 4-coumarate--CoA ligase [Halovibrio salipaludis]
MQTGTDTTLAVLSHLIGNELASQRAAGSSDLVTRASAGGSLRDGPLAVDSIEQLALARVVNEFFDLEASGLDEWLLRKDTIEDWVALIREGLADGARHIGFRSGGTTGDPKLNRIPLPQLEAEVALIAGAFADRRRIIGVAPPHHIYGFLWGPLLADALDVPYCHGDMAHRYALDPAPGDLVVAFPEWWRYRSARDTGFSAGIAGVTSTAPCPPEVIRALEDKGLDAMTEVYGSSETGGIAWRSDPASPFTLLNHWERANDGDASSLFLRPLKTRVTAPDELHWHDQRTLTPAGRRDGAIQVAGTNVDPAAIGRTLVEHPDVAECAVRSFETGSGSRLKAFVVPAADGDRETLEKTLREWVNARLTTPERPVRFDFGTALPRNELGKLSDW